MTHAYSELYLEDASLALGSMLESAVYLMCKICTFHSAWRNGEGV